MAGWLDALLPLSVGVIPLTSVVLDGHFGHANALQMARQSHLQLSSKLRYDAALDGPSTGSYAGRGPHRQSGAKVDDDHLPMPYLKETTVEGHIQTCVYQAQLLHKECPPPLHVVILATTNLPTQARAHVVLFSSDVDLAYAPLVAYDGLRCQIAFNFRDAKQYWGLEDFMHVTPTGVTNAAHLALFMVKVASCRRTASHPRDSAYSVLDLQADCRAYK
jgi:putative transposase